MSVKTQLDSLRARVIAQGGTVLDSVEGEVVLDDLDDRRQPRRGPVLVLRSIEEGAKLTLTHPRAVTVLGSLSGQVFGAYRVKAGNLLSGRLEGVRHVEIVHNMGSKGRSNVDAWVVFEATSDPGFFARAEQGLARLRVLEARQITHRESTALALLLRAVSKVPYDMTVSIAIERRRKTVFTLRPQNRHRPANLDMKGLLGFLIAQTEQDHLADCEQQIEAVKTLLRSTITESLILANSGGVSAGLRRQRGLAAYEPYVQLLYDYLLPKVLAFWLKVSEELVQRVVDRLGEAPMILQVAGQIAPFFQIEYPRWKFHVTGGRIVPEKIADCNIACQKGADKETLRLMYNYVGGQDWVSQTQDLPLSDIKACKLILKNGSVYLTEESHCLFGPHLKSSP